MKLHIKKRQKKSPQENPLLKKKIPLPVEPLAVIDIGSTAIRMTIAEVDKNGKIRPIEYLQHSVNLGRDAFTKGLIEKTTIEECVHILEGFRIVLDEYRITDKTRLKTVATNAVQEASNRDAFIDRIFCSTGIIVETIDSSDVARLNYLGVRPLLKNDPRLSERDVLIVEIGGGGTEVCCIQKERMAFTQAYRLGSLRLSEMLQTSGVPLGRQQEILENDIERTIDQLCSKVSRDIELSMVALGGDIRFAAAHILNSRNNPQPLVIETSALKKFIDTIFSLSVNNIVKKFHIPFSEAETVGPALLFYLRCAQRLGLQRIVVAGVSMRHGLFLEMVGDGSRTEELRDLIVQSALAIAEKYDTHIPHVKYVAKLSSLLFKALQAEHRLGSWDELLLVVAALLHDIGLFISSQNHHKHSQYLIQNCELFGMSRRDIRLVALIARYHRRSPPRPPHVEYAALDRDEKAIVSKLAAILRIADALDRAHAQRISDIHCTREPDKLILEVPNVDDLTLEQLTLRNKGGMFEDVFGLSVYLRASLSGES